ncbi:hypothetical protein SISSUDRAFT_1056592 [Sistotremastrum suecicum HHB10207 ss-3]|uniref:Uncharacterized protein n=1 Tax=Sistotremastrum suecicum HHB10207 ss-3 TaxID=1314776 RepID=A0A165WJ07_9AGAM|nr:hypothetical protein SISSUDRAFT_1056592 [Sistotremastrum suecicum HHB10207 ss-3]
MEALSQFLVLARLTWISASVNDDQRSQTWDCLSQLAYWNLAIEPTSTSECTTPETCSIQDPRPRSMTSHSLLDVLFLGYRPTCPTQIQQLDWARLRSSTTMGIHIAPG